MSRAPSWIYTRQMAATPDGWAEVEGALQRDFRFANFAEALAFVTRIGELAEAENHHPDVEIHSNRVRLRWWTHLHDAITERDHELARKSNGVFNRS
jgi:4a-hydroxytetrahydrobiopterin dehydratase